MNVNFSFMENIDIQDLFINIIYMNFKITEMKLAYNKPSTFRYVINGARGIKLPDFKLY